MSKTPAPSSTSTSLAFYTTTVSSILDNLNSSDEVIDDADQRVVYNGSWVQNLNDGSVPSRTSHSSIVVKSRVTLDFNGTGIDVLGTATLGTTVIQALYEMDGNKNSSLPRQLRSVSGTSIAIACQTFFSVRGLAPGAHSLDITINSGVNPREFVIDSFVVLTGDTGDANTVPAANLLGGANSTTADLVTNTAAPSSTATTGQSLSPSSLPSTSNVSSVPSTISPAGTAVFSTQTSSVNNDTQSQSSTSGALHMSTRDIVGLVVGSVGGLVLLIALIFILRRWLSIRGRQTPKPDTTPRPLFTERRRTHFSINLGRKDRNEFRLLQPPKYEFRQTTSPGPPSDAVGAWVDSFEPDIHSQRNWF